jgi:hypothetical protein
MVTLIKPEAGAVNLNQRLIFGPELFQQLPAFLSGVAPIVV